MGWFFGFKLHMIINDVGQIMAIKITKGNIDDRTPVPDLTKKLKGSIYTDKGYEVQMPIFGFSSLLILKISDLMTIFAKYL